MLDDYSRRASSPADDDIALLNALAASYANFGQFETASTLLEMSVQLYDENPETHKIRAVVAMRAGRKDEALEALDTLEDLVPLDDDMMRLRSHAMALQSGI